MVDLAQLEAAAAKNMSPPAFSGDTALARMIDGFQQAKQAIFKYVPAGYMLSFDQAVAAKSAIEAHLNQYGDAIMASLNQGQNLDDAIAFRLNSEQCRQYVLSNYAIACEGIGAYVTGYAETAVTNGQLTRQQYDEGIDVRTSTFWDIVTMEREGHLYRMLRGEEQPEKVMMSTPEGRANIGNVDLSRAVVVIKTGKTGLYVPQIDPKRMSGVGELGTAIIVGIIVAAVVAVAVIAFFIVKDRNAQRSAEIMREQCANAAKYGLKDQLEACQKFASDLNNQDLIQSILGKDAGKDILKYAAIGIGALLIIQFLPQITSSLMTTQSLVQSKREQRLLREAGAA